MKIKKSLKISLIVLLAVCLFAGGAFAIYVSDYYHAENVTYAVDNNIEKAEYKGYTMYGDQNAAKGLIFYPGGKVEASAYEPLMCEIANKGYFCVLLEVPFRLAVFDINAADGIKEQFSGVSEWYLGGHSLGGAMAASYASEHQNEYKGLVLMAAYPTKELSDDFQVLSIYGSEDGVLNKQKYEKALPLAAKLIEVVISGGNHGQFGNYGVQKGDGEATISAKSQWEQTAEAMSRVLR